MMRISRFLPNANLSDGGENMADFKTRIDEFRCPKASDSHPGDVSKEINPFTPDEVEIMGAQRVSLLIRLNLL